jgi:putative CocE/NonD family hydrolase
MVMIYERGAGDAKPGRDPRIWWGVRIPMRDGVHLAGILYLPEPLARPVPAIFTLTPYIAQNYHAQGLYFAQQGYPFLSIDVRGRGNSEGVFDPNINEGRDGYDIVEWLARQPYCSGRVAMWGGSYAGHDQWNTAREFPPHLATIVPAAAPYIGLDFPFRNNIGSTYVMQWLTLVSGRTSQERIFGDQAYWNRQFRRWFDSGARYRDLDTVVGNPSAVFQQWLTHPYDGRYWEAFNPNSDQYGALELPILTITGVYDGDQPGALRHYREHLKYASPEAGERHYLVIGPWDHAGTREPKLEFAGVKVGPDSLVDLAQLHLEWYAWTMQEGPRPGFLRKRVCYYVMGAETWRYVDTLDEVTSRTVALYLDSQGSPTDVSRAGGLCSERPMDAVPDEYEYNPLDVSIGLLESSADPENRSEERIVTAQAGKHLVYQSTPFRDDTELSGFFRLQVWISIDQPDTDFRASIYEVGREGRGLLLTSDSKRARYRNRSREAELIRTAEPLRYDFESFPFVSRVVKEGATLRLVVGPINSIFHEKNYNAGGVVASECASDARTVRVRVFHDASHPSVLYLPIGRGEAQ